MMVVSYRKMLGQIFGISSVFSIWKFLIYTGLHLSKHKINSFWGLFCYCQCLRQQQAPLMPPLTFALCMHGVERKKRTQRRALANESMCAFGRHKINLGSSSKITLSKTFPLGKIPKSGLNWWRMEFKKIHHWSDEVENEGKGQIGPFSRPINPLVTAF